MKNNIKNSKKGISTVWAITIIAVLALIVGTYVYVASKKGWDVLNVVENIGTLNNGNSNTDNNGQTPSQPNTPAAGNGMRAIAEDGFTITYSASLANEVKIVETLPDNINVQLSGTALVPSNRLAQLGERKCYYGESGILTECRIEKEDRISFFTVSQSLEDLTARYEATQLTAVTVSGVKSVMYRNLIDGDGTDVYFIPIDNNKTAIIKRIYDTTGFPTKAQFDAILATVKINDQ
jgi:hypothetical protein